MAASAGLVGLGTAEGGLRRPEEHILPYREDPERNVVGVPDYFATAFESPSGYLPILVETHQARPTKIEGNPSYSPYGGATDIYAQASLLDLYDPDRLRGSTWNGRKISLAEAQAALKNLGASYLEQGGEGLAILSSDTLCPTQARLKSELKAALPKLQLVRYNALASGRFGGKGTTGIEDSLRGCFVQENLKNRPVRALDNLSASDCLLSLDADFLNSEENALYQARSFVKNRRPDTGKMNRLYVVESRLTLTGSCADHRLRLPSARMELFALALVTQLYGLKGKTLSQSLGMLAAQEALGHQGVLQSSAAWIREVASDLLKGGSRSWVTGGAHLSARTHCLIALINLQLKSKVRTYVALEDTYEGTLEDLDEAVLKQQVSSLIILGGNPVYDAPSWLSEGKLRTFKRLMQEVPLSVRVGSYSDETSAAADCVIAESHYLETWGDAKTFDGYYVPVQPLIMPLFETLGKVEVLSSLAGKGSDPYTCVRETFAKEVKWQQPLSLAFETFLAEGLWKPENLKRPHEAVELSESALLATLSNLKPADSVVLSKDNLELRFVPSFHTLDGRFSNNAWMLECPDPISRLTWDNVIAISPHLAKLLGLEPQVSRMTTYGKARPNANTFKKGMEQAQVGRLQIPSRGTVEGPIHVQPGLADYTVVLPLGFGRSHVGRVGTRLDGSGKAVGFNAYGLLRLGDPAAAWHARLSLTGKTFPLANVQEHWSMEGRALVREAHLKEHLANRHWAKALGAQSHGPPVYGANQSDSLAEKAKNNPRGFSLYQSPVFKKPPRNVKAWEGAEDKYPVPQQWGMNIDLNACVACNACVIACQSENNIPTVGKDQVLRGREMHWIRIDRYYSSSASFQTEELPKDPQVAFMSVACMHCETAPCESVCPVNATVHDTQGLNTMAYNRCVGTRYCSNNCPYKVRRFNFFDYNKRERRHYYEGPFGPNRYLKDEGKLAAMRKNPDVTVRMRGVMEKCTYCIQRIESAKIRQKVQARDSDNVQVPDGGIQTACQQVCPTDAIVFGDIGDPQSKVSEAAKSPLSYGVLSYLNTRPRTTYQARVRNPNARMPDYQTLPLSRIEYDRRSGHHREHKPEGGHR